MVIKKARIVIADAQMLIVEGLRSLLANHEQYELVSVIQTRELLLWQLQKQDADLLIIDYSSLKCEHAVDLKEIIKELPQLKILVITTAIDEQHVLSLKNIGIQNILLKSADTDDLFRAISDTLKGKKSYPDEIMDLLLKPRDTKAQGSDTINLTQSEKDIVRLIVEGITTKEIAARKFISFHTVMTHRKNIFKKLSINSSSELVMYAVKVGLVETIDYHI